MFYGKNVLRSSIDDKTGLDIAFEELSNKCHQFLQYFILYQLWIVDLKHVLEL